MLPRLFTHSHTYTHMCTLLHPHKCTLHPLQVARITSAEKQANSAKLLKLQADLGEGDQRQIMAGELCDACFLPTIRGFSHPMLPQGHQTRP